MLLRLFNILRGGGELDANWLVQLASLVFVVTICLSAHECAHAWAAKKLGDQTAMLRGRLTLNPARHLSLAGTLMILLVGFGFAKPVPVQPRFFKNPKKGMALTAAAGPLSNLLMAVALMFFAQLTLALSHYTRVDPELADMIYYFFAYAATFNVSLMVFNLIPVPPLDGARILDLFLPMRASLFFDRIERYLMFGIFIVAYLLSGPIGWLTGVILKGIYYLTSLPFFWVK